MSDVISLLQQTQLGQLDALTLSALADHFETVSLAKDELLFRQDDPGDSMYLVVEGHLEVLLRDPEGREWLISLSGRGDFVGEMALLTGQDRNSTVRAAATTLLHRLSKADFEEVCLLDQNLIRALSEYIGPKLQTTQLIGVLANLFGVLDMATLMDLQLRLTWLHIYAGEELSFLEEPQGSMYFVVNGRIRVETITPGGDLQMIGEMGKGDTVGGLNLLTGENNKAILTAIRDTDIARISQDAIATLLQRNPESVLTFVRRTASRMNFTGEITRSDPLASMTIALVPLSQGVHLTDFTSRLNEELAVYGPSLPLSSQRFDQHYGRSGVAQTTHEDPTNLAIVQWLAAQEQRYKFVLYECDPKWTPWTQRCLRQADRIVLIGEADDSPAKGEIEQALLERGYSADQELVLLHPASRERPSGTKAWLAPRTVKAYHHVRLSNAGDFGRLTRRLIGKEVALVLSGGGARGFAHAGVYRALREAGIPVDLIGGTSIGALVGSALALDSGYDGVLAHAQKWGAPQQLFDFTIPAVSFMASHKLTRMIQELCGDNRIEDLWRSFFCVSANLTSGQPVAHREGLLWEAVRGSLALPGIFVPFSSQGDVLVDGGVMNNFPVDLMRQRCPTGWITGVNVSPPKDVAHNYEFEPGLSGWRFILNSINPFGRKTKAPSIFSTLTRSTEVKGIYQLALVEDKADMIINPDVSTWSFLDFRPSREIAEVGYRTTMAVMDELTARLKANGFKIG